MIRKLLLLLVLSGSYTCVNAATLPKSQGFDKRVTAVKYNPSDVVRVRTRVGKATLIQLEKGETIVKEISGIGMGDASAWGFNVRGNSIFLKPTARNPDTNLLIVTDKHRLYSFELVSSKYPHYVVKLQYEQPKKPKDFKPRVPCSTREPNFDYLKWGDDSLSPQYAWDDGRFLCMKFAENSELPVVFQVGHDGEEQMVNYHIEKDTMVLHSLAPEYRLRIGKLVLGVKSESAKSQGYNKRGTTIDANREVITP
ncbi:TrbG/VirB9 family P-type conjugative transfer protein [Enterovibrio calviensis]|uniref:TrbG/VirB9 family P-type conjugative transfer protein n=1 Tax=Enterovibrio calviensis TaxID=91359 RepID=UPI0037351382